MPKSIVSRPLDLFYIIFFIVHLAWSLPFEGQPIYPKWMISDWARQFVKDYIRDTNDPWMLGVWSLTDTPFEWIWTKVFLWFEMTFSVPVMFVGMYGLLNDIPTYYPLLIAYSAAALLATITTTVMTLAVPTKSDVSLSPQLAIYAMPDDHKRTVAIANIVFLIPQMIMLVDITSRTTKLIRKGIKAEKERKRV